MPSAAGFCVLQVALEKSWKEQKLPTVPSSSGICQLPAALQQYVTTMGLPERYWPVLLGLVKAGIFGDQVGCGWGVCMCG